MKVLIIRLSSIGDIFHTFTLLADIKKALPTAQIDWLVDENFHQVVELSPLVNSVIAIPLRKWKQNKLSWLINLVKFKRNLIHNQYDYIIDTQGLIKSAIIAKYLFKGPIYGLDWQSAREKIASVCYDYKYTVTQENVAVIRLRGLIAAIFKLEHALNDYEFAITSTQSGIKFKTGHIVFLHGTSKEDKKWPLANWLQLAKWLIAATNYQLIITYSNPQEQLFCDQFAAQLASDRLSIVPKLPFKQLAGLIKDAQLVIGVDTGFTHLANLLGKPTLAIYLMSNPGYVGMLESPIAHNLGGYKCQVTPQEVINYLQYYLIGKLCNAK